MDGTEQLALKHPLPVEWPSIMAKKHPHFQFRTNLNKTEGLVPSLSVRKNLFET